MQRRTLKRKYAGADPGSWKKYKYNPKSTVGSLTRKVNKILSEQERKNFDVSGSTNLVAGTAQIIQLSSIAQGDDAISRDGRKVAKVSSQMRYTMNGGSDATVVAVAPFRVIVLHDSQSNGVSPVAADILTAPTNIRSPLTLDFKERFRVIHDNFAAFKKGNYGFSNGAATETVMPCEYFYKFPDMLAQSEFGGIGNIPTSGAVVMLVLCETSSNRFQYYHRLRFTDS